MNPAAQEQQNGERLRPKPGQKRCRDENSTHASIKRNDEGERPLRREKVMDY